LLRIFTVGKEQGGIEEKEMKKKTPEKKALRGGVVALGGRNVNRKKTV